MDNKEQKISKLLLETGQAHHSAFFEVDGEDPEWPIWYADFTYEQMTEFLQNNFTKSEFIYALVHLSKVQPQEAPNTPWSDYYASFLVDNYG